MTQAEEFIEILSKEFSFLDKEDSDQPVSGYKVNFKNVSQSDVKKGQEERLKQTTRSLGWDFEGYDHIGSPLYTDVITFTREGYDPDEDKINSRGKRP